MYVLMYLLSSIVGDKTSKCPNGAAACRIHGDNVYDVGQPEDKLKRNVNGNLELRYTSKKNVTGCTVTPATTIEFRCPKQGGVSFSLVDIKILFKKIISSVLLS